MEDVKEGKDYSFPAEEQEILRLWDEIDAFKEQLRRTEGRKKFTFYDGPPFATGLPHYGHLLAGTIKVGYLVFAYLGSITPHTSVRYAEERFHACRIL